MFLHRIDIKLQIEDVALVYSSQSTLGNIGSSPIKTLDQPHRKFFSFFSFKKRTRKRVPNLLSNQILPHIDRAGDEDDKAFNDVLHI